MNITKISFKNFRAFEYLEIELPFKKDGTPLPVVFIGKNGSGKSTILDGVGIFLTSFIEAILFRDSLYPFDLWLKNEDINFDADFVQNSFQFKIQKEAFSFENYIVSTGGEDNRGFPIHESKLFNEVHRLYHTMANYPILVYYPSNRVAEVENADVKWVQTSGVSQTYVNAFSSKLHLFNDFIKWFEIRENFENSEKLERQDLSYQDTNLEAVRRAITIFLNQLPDVHFSNLKVRRVQKNGKTNVYENDIKSYLTIQKNGKEFKLSQLSDGEKMLILMVSDIARRLTFANHNSDEPLKGSGIVLIDEIDLHLHPEWQRGIVAAFQKAFPNIQFIATTHSSLIINHLANESVFLVENNTCIPLKEKLTNFNTYGADIEDILKVVQQTEQLLPKDVTDKLNTYFALIDANKIDEAKALQQELKRLTDPQHPEILKGQTLIDLKAIGV